IDLLIDFSAPNANSKLYDAIELSKLQDKAVLIGTTGLSENQKKAWEQLAKARHLRLLQAPNTSLGVLLTLKISEQVARILDPLHFDIEVLETHHRAKIDAPSGTANFLAEGLAASIDKKTIYGRKGLRQTHEIGVASLRGGTVFGEHEVRFLGDHEEITISHRALSRKLFAQGALILAAWILAKEPGSWTLHDISIDEILDLLADKLPKP
ncbi:MAG: 4-hydroxy-tetrahydrodipicolinate reductase, partial [Proteobacteria bacterium]|nr:4-hydroxy-tetrahydrodipicolinate reductase [Pseudomonadota bacterium]